MIPEIRMKWLGAAGFRMEYGGRVILIDPFVSRSPNATPVVDLRPEDLADADHILISHGHFDHLADVPAIASLSGAPVYCSSVAAATLAGKGVPPEQVRILSGQEHAVLDGIEVTVTPTRHIRFDVPLIARTLPEILPDLPAVLGEIRGWPKGPVLYYTFDFGGFRFTHAGSLGVRAGDPLVADFRGVDVLMPALQGHTHICRRAAELTADVAPRAVIPQHQDDFFPPVSREVSLEPFRAMVKKLMPECVYYEPVANAEFSMTEVLGAGSRKDP